METNLETSVTFLPFLTREKISKNNMYVENLRLCLVKEVPVTYSLLHGFLPWWEGNLPTVVFFFSGKLSLSKMFERSTRHDDWWICFKENFFFSAWKISCGNRFRILPNLKVVSLLSHSREDFSILSNSFCRNPHNSTKKHYFRIDFILLPVLMEKKYCILRVVARVTVAASCLARKRCFWTVSILFSGEIMNAKLDDLMFLRHVQLIVGLTQN